MQFKYESLWSVLIALAFVISVACTPMFAQEERKVTKLTEGVYAIQHAGNGGGNTTVIIGDRQVLVVDTGFLPSAAREDVAQIRQWTDKPVSFVLITHFHNDHNLGDRIYMDAFPALTIIAHVETKKDMDLFGPGSLMREERTKATYQKMLDTGTTGDGKNLTDDDKKEIKSAITSESEVIEELKNIKFQSATLTFDHDFSIDIGNRLVQIMFLGRGNTTGDAVAYLPKEKIVVAGDLVAYPIPNTYDGYPVEWIQTLQNLAQLDASAIVPGHGPVLHDKTYIYLVRDLIKSAVDQMNEKLKQNAPAMFMTLDQLKSGVDLTPLRERFVGTDKDLGPAFDDMAANLVKVVFEEATLR